MRAGPSFNTQAPPHTQGRLAHLARLGLAAPLPLLLWCLQCLHVTLLTGLCVWGGSHVYLHVEAQQRLYAAALQCG